MTLVQASPSISFSNLSQGQQVKGKLKITAVAKFDGDTSKTISYVAISEKNATSDFLSSSAWNSHLDSSMNIDSVNDVRNYSWTLDTTKIPLGVHQISIAVEDSMGMLSTSQISVEIFRPLPIASIVSPSSNANIQGNLTVKIQAKSGNTDGGGIVAIGVNDSNLAPQFSGSQMSSSNSDFPVGFTGWSVKDLGTYTFVESEKLLLAGPKTLTFIVLDDQGFSTTIGQEVVISNANPRITITNSPSNGLVPTSIFKIGVNVQTAIGSTGSIKIVGIDDATANPAFSGSTASSAVQGIPTNARLWSVNKTGDFIWNMDPASWTSGIKRLNIFAIDSNDHISIGSIDLYVLPKATWVITQREPAILGKSVLVSIDMQVDQNWRKDPPVNLVVQTATAPSGPWTEVGPLTLDSLGSASARVMMNQSVTWVRVNHPNQDSVQIGASAAKQLLSVPDNSARQNTEQSGTRLVNEDGTSPSVKCSLLKASTTISCKGMNVKDSSQYIFLQVLKGRTWSNVKKIKFASVMTIKFAKKSKVTQSYRLIGLAADTNQNPFIPWNSNIVKSNGI